MNTSKTKVICIAGNRHLTEKHGGVELQTHYIGQILADAGWHVHFLSPSIVGNNGCEKMIIIHGYGDIRNSVFLFNINTNILKPLLNKLVLLFFTSEAEVNFRKKVLFSNTH
jgi:hypothetical protein